MNYITRYLKKDSKIIEVGAGTGRYSLTLASLGYEVTAVELVEKNLEVLKSHIQEGMNVHPYLGDALDLTRFDDQSFDLTLVLGPLYHLFNQKDVSKCIEEAIRVTKKDGILILAFIPIHALMLSNYFYDKFIEGLEENFTDDYHVKHHINQLFTGYEISEFEELLASYPVKKITLVSADHCLEAIEKRPDFSMNDEQFEQFTKLHLSKCENRDLLGVANHCLYIAKKEG